jgi:hypothetical protein
MRMRLWEKCMYCVFSVLLGPALALATTPACQSGKPTPESYTYNFPNEATNLLNREGMDAANVRHDANLLQAYEREGVSWQMYAGRLNRAATQVNKMDGMLCRLRTIKRVTSPWQKRMIARITPQVTILTDEVNDAIHLLNKNEDYTWSPTFVSYFKDMYATSSNLHRDLRSVEEYARMHVPAIPMAKNASPKVNS